MVGCYDTPAPGSILRVGGSWSSRLAHNQEITGSSPVLATNAVASGIDAHPCVMG